MQSLILVAKLREVGPVEERAAKRPLSINLVQDVFVRARVAEQTYGLMKVVARNLTVDCQLLISLPSPLPLLLQRSGGAKPGLRLSRGVDRVPVTSQKRGAG
jgi:hypothetical protein